MYSLSRCGTGPSSEESTRSSCAASAPGGVGPSIVHRHRSQNEQVNGTLRAGEEDRERPLHSNMGHVPAGYLDSSYCSAMRGLLGAQLAELDLQAARMGQLKERIGGLLGLLDESVMPDAEQFMTALEMISVYESYFGQEVRDDLAKRRMRLGGEAMEGFRAEWLVLLREAKDHMLANTPVDDPRVREVSARWEALATALQSGDQQVDERAQAAGMAFWRDNSAEISEGISRQIDWLDAGDLPAIMSYFERVRKARDDQESGE